MKNTNRILLALLGCNLLTSACVALPFPIKNGVLTGPLNGNGQAITDVGSVTFGDGTVQNTAAAPQGFTGTVVTSVTSGTNVNGVLVAGAGTVAVNGVYFPSGTIIWPNGATGLSYTNGSFELMGFENGAAGHVYTAYVLTDMGGLYGGSNYYSSTMRAWCNACSPPSGTTASVTDPWSTNTASGEPTYGAMPAPVVLNLMGGMHYNLTTFSNGVCVTNVVQ